MILQLARMAGINYRAIYKATTIDPPGTVRHCREQGVEILWPRRRFFEMIERSGFPTRRTRFCCGVLKEYKVLPVAVHGIRAAESPRRKARYQEPQICRIYRSKKNRVSVFLPILQWTDEDIHEFVTVTGTRCHPLYYDADGSFHAERRLGCLGCPLRADQGLSDFRRYPSLVRVWLKHGKVWWDTHPNARSHQKFADIYELFLSNVFFPRFEKFAEFRDGLFGHTDCKRWLEDYFGIDLTV